MKIKYADYIKGDGIAEKDFKFKRINSDEFNGYAAISYFRKVTEPRYAKMNGKRYMILDKGYTWIQYFPDDFNYAVTVMFNTDKEIIQWYFDVCRGNKIDERGIPYFYDLYLDVVLLSNGDIMVLDEDELEEAFNMEDITNDDYNMAKNMVYVILGELNEDKNSIVHLSKKHIKEMEQLLK